MKGYTTEMSNIIFFFLLICLICKCFSEQLYLYASRFCSLSSFPEPPSYILEFKYKFSGFVSQSQARTLEQGLTLRL